MKKHDLWMFLPTLKKPTRVSFEQRLTGEVSNGDLARTNFASDYDSKLISEDKVDNKACYKLLLTANTKDVAYRQIVYWVEKNSYLPVQVKFYALSGKLLKTGKYSSVKHVLDKNRVTQLTITDALHGKRQSTLNYFDFKKTTYDDTFFSRESLSD
jgi:outer membrane lipoprotein-sorting protein